MSSRCLLVALACVAIMPSCKKKAPAITVPHETEVQRADAVKAAFAEGADSSSNLLNPSDPVFAEVDAYFTKLGKATRARDSVSYRECLSLDAMIHNLEAKGLLSFSKDRERAAFKKGAEGSLGRSMNNMAFDRHVVARLEKTAPDQVMAFTRTYNQDLGVVNKMRWWLVKEDGTWKTYDFEELTQGVRVSTMIGAMVGGSKGKPQPWVDSFMKLAVAMQNLNSDNLVDKMLSLRKLTEEVLKHSPPPEIALCTRQLLVSGMIANGEFDEALAEVEALEKLPNISPGLQFIKGTVLTTLEKPVEARAAFETYAEHLGWDSDVHEMVADTYLAEDNRKAALEHALKGLAEYKDATGCLASAVVAAGAEGVGALAPHFDAASDPENAYDVAIGNAIDSDEPEIGRALLAMLKKSKPDSELIAVYEAHFAEEEEAMEEE